jgi:pimeloyl-ACP methyl ester carboxylesterase
VSAPGAKPTIVIVPGYNEPDNDMSTLSEGRRGLPGLKERGYDCVAFPRLADDLSDRIDRYAEFLDGLKVKGVPFPIVSLGYSLGGLVVRGFLRKYPERAGDVAHTITLGTPHWGITADMLPMLTFFLRLRDHAMHDLDIRSNFMQWLNQSRGHWVGRLRHRNWVMDEEPWVAPHGACLFSICGIVPKFGDDNDGIVWRDSGTLGGRIRSCDIRHEHANHLNLIGAWNLGTTLIKRFKFDDEVWPRSIAAIAGHIEAHVVAEAVEAAAAS